ncbi:MAG: hypothetical protein Tsb002_18430 [Wenzhouxiangellaceae bacterium]
MTILAIIIALLLNHAWKGLHHLRSNHWLPPLVRGLQRLLGGLPLGGAVVFLLVLLLPLALVVGLEALVIHYAGALAQLVFVVVVVVYTIGPRDLDSDVRAVTEAASEANLAQAAGPLLDEPLSSAPEQRQEQLIQGVFCNGLRAWFGVIFWFIVLGPMGALLFRLSRWLLDESTPLSESQRLWAARLNRILEWPTAQLMTLGLAIAADFDTVITAWRHYHREQGHALWEANNGFMLAAALEAVKGGHANRDGFSDQLDGPLSPVKLAMDLLWRLLAVWLVALALILLAGWIA